MSAVAPCMLTGLLSLPWLARSLNVFLLGEAEAGHLGIQIERLKRRVIVLVALVVGAASPRLALLVLSDSWCHT